MEKDYLILKRASASRTSGEWREDDYDVLAEGVVVGRIFKANAAPVDAPVDVDTGLRTPRGPPRQRTATRRRPRQRWPPSLRAGTSPQPPSSSSAVKSTYLT